MCAGKSNPNIIPNYTNSKTNPKANPTDPISPTLLTLTLFERLAEYFHLQFS